ncbi:MAG: acetylxylan esterase [Spirochaetes bacterium]|nr:MAG: acetylxylan esterase [Spirochaetota bacterium]RKX76490.1 MAG: acetylxylan esterase [Spirochaetota bacterium]
MPVVDLSLDELKTYTGTNPRPEDFNEYWKKALDEMKSVDPDVEILKSGFQAPGVQCFDYFYTGVAGARIHAKYLRPEVLSAGERAPAVVFFHGYTGNAGSWMSHLAWASAGYHIWAMDCRGQGGLSEDPGGVSGNTQHGHIIRGLSDSPEKLYFRQVFLDAAELAGLAMETEGVDPKRVGARGGSQGGGLTLACAALEPRIACLTPVFPFLSDYQRVWELDLAKRAYVELVEWFRRFDPMHERENEIFTRLGYIDVQHLAERIKGKVLMASGLMDEVCPPSSQFAAFNKITSSKSLRIFPDFGHETLTGFDDIEFSFFRDTLG